MPTDHNSAEPSQSGEDEFTQNPHAVYDMLRVEAPVCEVVAPGGTKVWMVTRYEDAKAALADARLSKSIEGGQKVIDRNTAGGAKGQVLAAEFSANMLNSDPPYHTRLRKQVQKAFTMHAVEKLRPRIVEIADDLLDAMESREQVDLMSAFAYPLPMSVICGLLGVPKADRKHFHGWVPTQMSGSLEQGAPTLVAYLHELVEHKRSEPGDDLLSALVQSTDEDKLTTQELVSMAFVLMVAGHETTVNLIGNGMFALLQHPDQFAELLADRSLLPGAIEEFLRYECPVNTASLRFTTEPIELGGVAIPEGELVVVAITSANRDESQYSDAGSLDVHRKTSASLAFGHGIHYCIGAPLARLEAQIAFDRLFDRFPDMQLAAEPADLRWQLPGNVMRGLEALPVRLRPEQD